MSNHTVNFKAKVLSACPKSLRGYWERIETSPLGLRLAKGAFWSLAGALISRGLALLSSIIVARFLGKEGFGELGIIQSTVGMFGVFAGFGLGMTATKYIAEFRTNDPERAGRVIALSNIVSIISGGVMSLMLVFLAAWLASYTLAAPHLTRLLQIAAGLLFFSALTGAQTGALSGFEAFKTIAWVNFLTGLTNFPLIIVGVYVAGLKGAVWALVGSMGVNWLVNHLALKRVAIRAKVPFTYRSCWDERIILWHFSLPAFLSSAMAGPVMWACDAMLVNQPNGYAQMGIYSAVMRIKILPEMILGFLLSPLLPVLSEQYGKKENESYNKTVNYALAIALLIVIPISLIQLALPSLTLLPFGWEFQSNYAIVQWLMFQAMLNALISPITHVLGSMNRMWFSWLYSLAWGIIYILSAYLLVPAYGAAGLAAAFTITRLLTSLPLVAYIYRYERLFVSNVPLVWFTGAILVLSLVCVLVSHIASPIVAGGVGIITAYIFAWKVICHTKRIGILEFKFVSDNIK